MKTLPGRHQLRGIAWPMLAGGITLLTLAANSAPFLYAPGDLVLTFRQPGSAADLVVNIGAATTYNAVPDGTTLPVANLATAQLTTAFPSLNGLRWSVAGAQRPPADSSVIPLQTLWVTAARLDLETQSAPWLRKGSFVQGNTASQVDGVGINASLASSLLPAGPDNTATGVIIPASHNFAIGPVIGDDGTYVGTFQGSVETVTPDDFSSSAENRSRADLYELLPGSTAADSLNKPGRYLGYFEFKPDGSLTFNTTVQSTEPRITAITRNGDVTTVSFTTTAGVTYQLRATDAAGFLQPVSTWSQGATVVGDGAIQTLQDTSTDAVRFYSITAQQ